MGQFILQTGWTFGWMVLVGVCGMIISEKMEGEVEEDDRLMLKAIKNGFYIGIFLLILSAAWGAIVGW